MARRLQSWDGQIDTLPPEILGYNIEELPRPTLKDIANRLHGETVSTGNWETLAERLGFSPNSLPDYLQNACPGLRMLQEWACRAGSTAHVLLHALREIKREDVINVLVGKLFETHSMQLHVNVQEGEGPSKFFCVATQKSAPLHASLDNTLQKPPYWYDIVGPRHDINWNTLSRELQGSQLSLKLRVEPNQNNRNEIYGTAPRTCQPPPLPINHLNIPVEPNLTAEESLEFQQNNLSGIRGPDLQQNANLAQSPERCTQLQPPPACRPLPCEIQDAKSELDNLEPMTNMCSQDPAVLNQFPDFDTLMPSVTSGYEFRAPSLREDSLDTSNNFDCPFSNTDVKQPVCVGVAGEDDETLAKETTKVTCQNQESTVKGNTETGFTEGIQFEDTEKSPIAGASFMHPDYVTHETLIEFCNNPVSPQSLNSDSSLTLTSSYSHHQSMEEDQTFDQGSAEAQSLPTQCRVNQRTDDYVPFTFIERQSQNVIEHMETEQAVYGNSSVTADKGLMDDHNQQRKTTSQVHILNVSTPSTSSNVKASKPLPCLYTTYKPRTINNEQYDMEFQPRPIPHSVSLGGEAGYQDMRGSHQETASQGQQSRCNHTSSARPAEINLCMSVDSYMNNHFPGFDLQNADLSQFVGNFAGNGTAPDANHLLHSRSRRPLPGNGDVFQPRDRRPLTQEHDMLLDDPAPEYTYVDSACAPVARGSVETASIVETASLHASTSQPMRYGSQQRLPERAGQGNVARRAPESRSRQRSTTLSSELQQVPGWNPNITDKTVEQEMSRYINDDGNFIVWHYAVGAKFVISVSHLRSIRHYAVYETELEGQVYYYIFPKGPRFPSLAALVQHCQKYGVTEPTKTFKTPDGRKQAHRSSGRFCHVRLKAPIPPRRN